MTSFADLTRYDGKVVLITGASSGLGAAMAVAFARQGADVAISGRRLEKLEQVAKQVEETGRRCVVVQADHSRVEDCQRFVQTAKDEYGRIDALINNAGLGTAVPMTRETPEQWQQVVDLNLSGVYWTAQAAVPLMERGGNILNVSSIMAIWSGGLPQAAYAATKAALLGLTRDLAVQLTGRKGIRINAIQPGYFPTEMTDQSEEEYLKYVADLAPIGRLGEVDELINAAIFLCSDAASYITGTSLIVDGGLTLR